jgi:hypothetical protein
MIAQSFKQEISPLTTLSMHDLLDESSFGYLTKYLSVSIKYLGEYTKVTLTTTGKHALCYSTVYPTQATLDVEKLVFFQDR